MSVKNLVNFWENLTTAISSKIFSKKSVIKEKEEEVDQKSDESLDDSSFSVTSTSVSLSSGTSSSGSSSPSLSNENLKNFDEFKEEEENDLKKKKIIEVKGLDDISKILLDRDHLQKKIVEVSDEIDIKDVNCNDLLKYCDMIEMPESKLKLWGCYSGSSIFSNSNQVKNRLKSVTNYAETNTKASELCKKRLKTITKLIYNQIPKNIIEQKENDIKKKVTDSDMKSFDSVGILCLLAQHGNVCNVEKEIGIRMAYSLITNRVHDEIKTRSLQQLIFRLLRDWRYCLVEKLYHTFPNAINNDHYIVYVVNYLSKHIGVDEIIDPDICTFGGNWKDTAIDKYFELYTPKQIIQFIELQMNDKPSKIPNSLITLYLEENCPFDKQNSQIKYSWFEKCFNMETGKIKTEFIIWILIKIGVFKQPDNLQFSLK